MGPKIIHISSRNDVRRGSVDKICPQPSNGPIWTPKMPKTTPTGTTNSPIWTPKCPTRSPNGPQNPSRDDLRTRRRAHTRMYTTSLRLSNVLRGGGDTPHGVFNNNKEHNKTQNHTDKKHKQATRPPHIHTQEKIRRSGTPLTPIIEIL